MVRISLLRSVFFCICICLSLVMNSQVKTGDINLALTGDITADQFNNYKAVININVKINFQQPDNIMNRYDANPIFSPVLKPNPGIETFVKRSLNDYLERVGFVINPAGLLLTATIEQFEINYLSGMGWTGSVKINWILSGSAQEELFRQSALGFYKMNGSADNFNEAANVINAAFFQAINQIDWGSVARTAGKVSPAIQVQPNNKTLANNNTNNVKPVEKVVTAPVSSDIDINIPVTYQKNDNTFAVIIGNENYDNEIQVKFAKNDAKTFSEYTIKTLGVPKENVHFVENATYGKMLGEIDWLKSVAKAYQGKAKLLFYYAGHGMPDESSKSAYLLPADGDASSTRTAIKVEELYDALSEYPVQQATVFLDACFSGAARDGMLASGRGVRIMPKTNSPKGNLVIFTAVSGDETAHPYSEKQHGLFSYFLMKKLQESKGDISLSDLSSYVATNVNQHSVVGGKEQNPTVNVSPLMQNTWQNLKLK